jgi:hypothetical protein
MRALNHGGVCSKPSAGFALALAVLSMLGACGLETVGLDVGRNEHLQEVNVFTGNVALPAPTMALVQPDGSSVTLTYSKVVNGVYTIKAAAVAMDNVVVRATQGDAILTAFVSHADRQQVMTLDVTPGSQALYLAMLGKLSAEKLSIRTTSPSTLGKFIAALTADMNQNGDTASLRDMVKRLVDAANKNTGGDASTATPMFQAPVLRVLADANKDYVTDTSAINPAWFKTVTVDYTASSPRWPTARASRSASTRFWCAPSSRSTSPARGGTAPAGRPTASSGRPTTPASRCSSSAACTRSRPSRTPPSTR